MRSAFAAFVMAALAAGAAAQEAPPAPGKPKTVPGGPPPDSPASVTNPGEWRSGTEEEWRKPVLITWQRTWEDALAVQKETGRPILICVNMDGEPASEHYASIRYRSPEVAKLYEPYVCVIASVYRHTPRDFDEQGRRIPCPRFGGVTCGEHIAIEPIVFETYFEGQRIAPRHIMVELDSSEVYDVFYANNVDSVLRTVTDGIAKRPGGTPPPVVRGDRPILDRVGSRDVADRAAVEAAWQQGDESLRRAIAAAAEKLGKDAPLDVLRMALFGLDPEAQKSARRALAQADQAYATDLLAEALKAPLEDAERESLVQALERIGEKSDRAQWLATSHRGLGAKSDSVDLKGWSRAAAADTGRAADSYSLDVRRRTVAAARKADPSDAKAALELAETSFELALDARRNATDDLALAKMYARHTFGEARKAAEDALAHLPPDAPESWRAHAVIAAVEYHDGDPSKAYEPAERAVKLLKEGEPGSLAVHALTIFAEGRFKSIKAAVKEKKRWPARWLSDVNAAYSVLRRHPRGTDAQVLWHYDFLMWLWARDQAWNVLLEGVKRFQDSDGLHEKLRARVLQEKGADGLLATYVELAASSEAGADLVRNAATAARIAAEFHRRGRKPESAAPAYAASRELWQRALSLDPELKDAATRADSMLLAAEARLALEREDFEAATTLLERAIELRPDVTGSLDGLGLSAAMTSQELLAKLAAPAHEPLRERIRAALAKVDPALLETKYK